MTTTWQPRRWAWRRNGMKCGAVLTGLCPHRMTRRLWTTSS